MPLHPQDNDTWALHEVDVGVGFYTNASYVYLSTNQSSKQPAHPYVLHGSTKHLAK